MTIDLQAKIEWINKAWIAIQNENQKWDEKTLERREKEAQLLIDELLQGLLSIINEIRKLYPQALKEIYDWEIKNENISTKLSQIDPNRAAKEPWQVMNELRQSFPKKVIEYFYCAALNLFSNKEYLRSDKAFRLLTILNPQNQNYWIWLALNQFIRKMPELSLISLTFAMSLAPAPNLQFYMAECWIELKEWEKARLCLEKCLHDCKDDPAHLKLTKSAEELYKILPTAPKEEFKMQESFQQFTLFPNSEPRPKIQNIATTQKMDEKHEAFTEKEIQKLLKDFQNPIKELEEALNKREHKSKQKISLMGSFEAKIYSLSYDEKGNIKRVSLPLEQFFDETARIACFFLGAFLSSMSVITYNKELIERIADDSATRFLFTLSSSIDRKEQPLKKGVEKYLYFYSPQGDRVLNRVISNPEYGSLTYSYQEYNREDNKIRASEFLPKDIIGKSILDFGCNQGGVLFACRNIGAHEITGVDLNPWCIKEALALVKEQKIENANFYVGDMENRALLSTLPQADTVLLLAILDTSNFANKISVIANVSRFAKETLYYEGHVTPDSHVIRMYELFIATDFTRFEYLGRFEDRVHIRCSRKLMAEPELPPNAITSDYDEQALLNAEEIYLFTDSPRNPPFSKTCRLIQFVKRSSQKL